MRNPEDQIRLVYDRVPLIVRLPFAWRTPTGAHGKIGLGDVVGKVLATVGIWPKQACRCAFRKAVLNSYVVFYGWRTPLPAGPFMRWNPAISREMQAQGNQHPVMAEREAR
jgi:hypothetical protein